MTIEKLYILANMTESERLNYELDRIQNLRDHGVATYTDEHRAHKIARRLAEIAFEAKPIAPPRATR